MEKHWAYLFVIIILLAILYIVGSFAIRGMIEPEGFTELSFLQGGALPEQIQNDREYPFSFAIANHQEQGERYTFRVIADGILLEEVTILVPASFTQEVQTRLKVSGKPLGKDIQVAVILPEKNQQIQQWVSVI